MIKLKFIVETEWVEEGGGSNGADYTYHDSKDFTELIKAVHYIERLDSKYSVELYVEETVTKRTKIPL